MNVCVRKALARCASKSSRKEEGNIRSKAAKATPPCPFYKDNAASTSFVTGILPLFCENCYKYQFFVENKWHAQRKISHILLSTYTYIYYTRARKYVQNGKARYRVRKVQRLYLVCMNKEIVLSGKAIRTNTPNTISSSRIKIPNPPLPTPNS